MLARTYLQREPGRGGGWGSGRGRGLFTALDPRLEASPTESGPRTPGLQWRALSPGRWHPSWTAFSSGLPTSPCASALPAPPPTHLQPDTFQVALERLASKGLRLLFRSGPGRDHSVPSAPSCLHLSPAPFGLHGGRVCAHLPEPLASFRGPWGLPGPGLEPAPQCPSLELLCPGRACTRRRHPPSVWTRMAEAEMSVVMAKAGIHRSCGETGLGGPPPCRRQPPPCGPGGARARQAAGPWAFPGAAPRSAGP